MNSRKQFIRIVVVLVLLLLGGLYYLYTQVVEAGDRWPYENEPGSLTNQVNQLNSEIRNLRAEVAKIKPAKEKLEALTIEYDLAARVLPRESSPDQLIAAIRTKAELSGVIPERLSPTVVPPASARPGRTGRAAGSFEEWRFALTIRGSYDQIATFVNRMEEFESSDAAKTGSEKRFFHVQNIEIAAEDNGMANFGDRTGSGPRGHLCNLQMATYRYTGAQ